MNWEKVEFLSLLLLIIGNITVGYYYLFAQTIFLIANIISLIRVVKLKRTRADIIKAISFVGMAAGLIIIRLAL